MKETIRSVLIQKEVRFEVIVIDDGSTDESASLVQAEFPEVRLVRTANQGVSAARNLGTQMATGKYLQYLDSDDLLIEGKLVAQMSLLEKSKADIAYGDFARMSLDVEGHWSITRIERRHLMDEPALHLFTDFWCPPAAYLFRRSIVNAVRSWPVNLPVIEDARFVLECAFKGGRFVRCEGLMARYREHPDSLSRSNSKNFNRFMLQNTIEVADFVASQGLLDCKWKSAILNCLDGIARSSYGVQQDLCDQALESIRKLDPQYTPARPWTWRVLSRLLGYERVLYMARQYRRLKCVSTYRIA